MLESHVVGHGHLLMLAPRAIAGLLFLIVLVTANIYMYLSVIRAPPPAGDPQLPAPVRA
jgi:hypothetical protein